MKRDFVMGSMCLPTQDTKPDQDAIKLQAALLGHKAPIDWDGIGIVVGMLAIIAMAAWGMA